MSGFIEKDGVLQADGVSLAKIAAEVGTPAYVYSTHVISDQFAKLKGAMEKALPKNRQPLLCFACKANSNVAVLKLLRELGSGLEIVSEGELLRGIKAGFDGSKIVSTGVGKQKSEIAACLKAGILQFNVESLPELEQINAVAGEMGMKAKVAFRLNPDVSGGGHHKISTGRKRDKFGMGVEMMNEAYAMAERLPNTEAVGLSMHIGSQVFEVEKFREAFARIPQVVKDLRSNGHKVSTLDIGGGFPIRYRDDQHLLDLDSYAQWVNDIIVPLDTQIIMEPGRYLVGNAGVILTEVLYVKETQDRKFLIIDAAMNDLIRPAMYDAYHGIEPVASRNAPWATYDVVGPVCETGDTFTTERELPAMKQGDLAVILSAGAYGASMASNYNTRPLAPEILVASGEYKVIRKRQTYEEIINRDVA
jgi:diaminopimelate decarboxylase